MAYKLQEATRIPTPPLDEDTADGRCRGFFTASTPPSMDGSQQPTRRLRGNQAPRSDVHRRSLANQPKEWWEQLPQRPNRRDMALDPEAFGSNVPEHLPNSPLCPAHRKHRGGGTGACVLHGQRKGSALRNDGAFMLESDEGQFEHSAVRRS